MQWQELRSHIRHLPARDIARIGQAFELGKKMHEGQKRRSGEPYFNHPVAVAHMLLDLKADTDTIIAALLHDTVEDTALTLQEIDHAFNGSVATIIDGVTKLSSKDVAMSPKLDEQIETLRKIFTLMQQDVRIMVIKLVDRLHNMQTVEFLPPERQRLLAKETSEVFVKIADKLCMQDMRDELESLCLAVLEPETYASLLELRNASEQRGLTIIDHIRSHLRNHDRILGSKTELVFEQKTWDQMKAQLSVGGSVATGISSITIAFVCEDTDACYRTLGALHQAWKREVLSFQDFINQPQLNGYRGVHTTIIAQDGTRVRCKIRTKEMHEYARSGITTKCFDTKALGIADYLPWTKRLSSLSTDTEGSSEDFWENLKSDILGDTIVIHGPDDTIVHLPRDATALDAVFYLFHERALNLDVIKMNGMKVPFSKTLVNAASLEVTLATDPTWNREWLRQVKTGYATALIRMALGQYAPEQKQMTGRSMLQQILTERKRGFIEEFEEESLKPALQKAGYKSLEEVFVAIADGRMEPHDAYLALFEKRKKATVRLPHSSIQYWVNMDALETMDHINLIHRRFGASLMDIRYHRIENNRAAITLRVQMRSSELAAFRHELVMAGAEDLMIRRPSIVTALLIGAIVVLWGLDPLVARVILTTTEVTPADLTFIRFMTFFCASTLTYGLYIGFSRVKSKPISPLKPSFIAAGIALFLTGILSYMSLRLIPASEYILFIIGGLVLTNLLSKILERNVSVRLLLSTTVIGIAIMTFIHIEGFSLLGVLAGTGGSLGFSMYSQLSRRYLETDGRIHARYPAFVFWLSVITIILTALLWPLLQPLSILDWRIAGLCSLFALVFTFLPYALYFECMLQTDTDILDRLLPFVCLITILSEAMIGGTSVLLYELPILILFLWLYKSDLSTRISAAPSL